MDKRKVISLVVLFFLVLALPLGIFLVQTKKNLGLGRRAAEGGIINASFSSASTSHAKGSSFDVTVQLVNSSTSTVQARVGTAVVTYDPAVFDIVGVTGDSDNPCAGGVFPMKAVGALEGTNKFEITCFKSAGSASADFPPSELKQLAKFTLHVKDSASSGSTTLGFDHIKVPKANQSNIDYAGTTTPISFTITGGDNPTGTPGPTGNGIINFKVKIREVDARPNSYYSDKAVSYKVILNKDGVKQTFTPSLTIGSDTVSQDGVWTVSIAGFSKVAGQYDVYVKGPRELQKKFLAVSLTADNSQNVDLTQLGNKYLLESGDLPIGTNGAQDGVVNSVDAVYLANCFGKDDDTCLMKSDLNYDGAINTIDTNIMNNTIYSRWEDEVVD